MKVVLASNNAGKIREFSELLKNCQIEIIPQTTFNIPEIEETGLTFIENALIKARHATLLSGLPAVADDSGLVVDALKGAPGIYSARYAGKEANAAANIQKLLTELKDVPDKKRQAYFYCVLVFMQHAEDPTPIVCQAKWHGKILLTPQGEKGFGYDPIFYVPQLQKTAAELDSTIKNNISHRGVALQSLMKLLAENIYECAVSKKSH